MASIIEQLQDRVGSTSQEARVLPLDEDDADAVIDALAPDLRRGVYRLLFEQPRTMSELAEELDTSVQNVQYHISALEEANLIEPVDTIYSAKGNEATVYGPTSDPLVFVGDEECHPGLEGDGRSQLVSGLALLGVASLLVQVATTRLLGPSTGSAGSVAPASPDASVPWVTDTLTWLVFGVLEPGLVFFVGGLLLATVAVMSFNGD